MSKNKQTTTSAGPKNDRPKNSAKNVNRKILNSLSKDRRKNPSVESMLQAWNFRQSVLNRKQDNNPETKRLREKFEREEFVNNRSCELFEQYRAICENANREVQERNLHNLWSQAVQAVKTDRIGTFQNIWNDRSRKVKNAA
jgi:hypothetical protein